MDPTPPPMLTGNWVKPNPYGPRDVPYDQQLAWQMFKHLVSTGTNPFAGGSGHEHLLPGLTRTPIGTGPPIPAVHPDLLRMPGPDLSPLIAALIHSFQYPSR